MENTFDAIVVGAGYVGCSVAYHLCAAGLKTALVDRGLMAAAASRANFGNIEIQDMELEKSVAMIKAAVPKLETLEQELDWKVGMRCLGGLLLIENENQWRLMAERMKAVRAAGFLSELVPSERLKEIEPLIKPGALLGGLYHPNEGGVDPFQFIWGHLVRARQRGLVEFYETEVTGFEVKGDRLEGLQTSRGNLCAGAVVLCTGARTAVLGEMLGRKWDVRYVLGQALATEPVRKALRNHVASAAFFDYTAENAAQNSVKTIVALSQSVHGHFLLGEAIYEAGHFNENVPYPSLPAVSRVVSRYFPSFKKLRVLRGWSAAVAHTVDGCPFWGPVAGLQGLFLATAFRSTVVTTPLVGELTAQLITRGSCDLDLASFSPERNMNHAH